MLVMLSSVTTRKTPGMRMTHHELRRSARSANANMLPHESTSTGRPSPRKLKVASIAMLVLMLEMTTNMIADTKFGMRCLRMMKGNRAPMQREARMYSLLRICRTSLRTMRDRANQPVTPMTRAMVSSFGLHRPHHGAVHHAGGDPGQAAVGNPDKGNDRGAHQPDEDGSPAAVPDDRVNVPPQRVRAEPEFGIGSLIDVHEEEFGGIMVDDQVGKKAAEGDHGKHGDGEGGLAFQSRPEAFFPYGGLVRPVPGPDDREGIVGRGVHQHTTPSEDFMRGSMTSLTACATRLLSMTIAPVISTMSISRL